MHNIEPYTWCYKCKHFHFLHERCKQRGISLIEVLVALVIAGILLSTLFSTIRYANRTLVKLNKAIAIAQSTRVSCSVVCPVVQQGCEGHQGGRDD